RISRPSSLMKRTTPPRPPTGASWSRSYWIPGSYAPTLSENHDSFFRLLKNKDCKEEKMTQVGLYAIGTSTTLESNKSLTRNLEEEAHGFNKWQLGLQ